LLTDTQYFKSIEAVAASQGFEQILPSAARTGPRPPAIDASYVNGPNGVTANGTAPTKVAPTILAPQPTTSTLLSAPATDYPVRSVTPELVPDSMASRIESAGLVEVKSELEVDSMASRIEV
jgi:glucosamine-6-phosphate deaminase